MDNASLRLSEQKSMRWAFELEKAFQNQLQKYEKRHRAALARRGAQQDRLKTLNQRWKERFERQAKDLENVRVALVTERQRWRERLDQERARLHGLKADAAAWRTAHATLSDREARFAQLQHEWETQARLAHQEWWNNVEQAQRDAEAQHEAERQALHTKHLAALRDARADEKAQHETKWRVEQQKLHDKWLAREDSLRDALQEQLAQELAALHASFQAQTRRLTEAHQREISAHVTRHQKIQSQSRSELQKTRQKLEEWQQGQEEHLRQLRTKSQGLQDRVRQAHERLRVLQAEQRQGARQEREWRQEHKRHEKALRTCEQDKARLQADAAEWRINATAHQKRLAHLLREHQKHHTRFVELSARLRRAEEKARAYALAVQKAQQEHAQEEAQAGRVKAELKRGAEMLQAGTDALQACEKKHARAQDVWKRFEQRCQQVQRHYAQQLKAHRARHAEVVQREQAAQKTVESLQAELSRALDNERARGRELSQCQAEGRKCLEQAQADARAASQAPPPLVEGQPPERWVSLARDLHRQLTRAHAQNARLRSTVKAWQAERAQARRTAKRHAQLRDRHHRVLNWVEALQHEQKRRTQERDQAHSDWQAAQNAVHELEEAVDELTRQTRHWQETHERLSQKADACQYPGEKTRLTQEAQNAQRQHETHRTRLLEAAQKHADAVDQAHELEARQRNLQVLETKSKADLIQMANATSEQERLRQALKNTKARLTRQDQQLHTVTQRLAAVVERNRVMTQREAQLRQRLGEAVAPAELEANQARLARCREQNQKIQKELNEVLAKGQKLAQQSQTDRTKIEGLVKVLTDTENVQTEWKKEHAQRLKLETAVRQCRTDRLADRKTLSERLQAVDAQYKQSLVLHDQAVARDQAHIRQLEARLRRMGTPRDTEAFQARAQALLQREAPPDVASATQAGSLEEGKRARAARISQMHAARQRESEVMRTRRTNYEEMLAALQKAHRSDNATPEGQVDQVRRLWARGAQRESETMRDMLQLRAINTKLAASYRLGRQAQWDLMSRAHRDTRQRLAQGQSARHFQPALQDLQRLTQAQHAFLQEQKQDGQADLRSQQAYTRELQDQMRAARRLESFLKTSGERFPQLQDIQKQLEADRRHTASALWQEQKNVTGHERSVSATEATVDALGAQLRALTQEVQRAAQKPTPENLDRVRELARTDPAEVQRLLRQRKALEDTQHSRVTYLVHPTSQAPSSSSSSSSSGPSVDPSTGELRLQPRHYGRGPQPPTQRYFGDHATVAETPQKTFAPSLARAQRAVALDHDLIVVCYGAEERPSASSNDKPLLYTAFLHALEQVWPVVQAASPDQKVTVQLVRIKPMDYRVDMLNGENFIQQGCTYATCTSTKQVMRFSTAATLMQSLFDQVKAENSAVTHTVLSLGWPDHPHHIHLTDVLYLDSDELKKDPSAVNLVDSSWISYLRDILEMPNTKVDMYFNMSPSAQPATNQALADLSDRLSLFLAQLRRAHKDENHS